MDKRKLPKAFHMCVAETGAHSQFARLCWSFPRLCGGNMEPPPPTELSDRQQQLETRWRWRVEKKTSELSCVVFGGCFNASEPKERATNMNVVSRRTLGKEGAVCKRTGEEEEEEDGRKGNFKVKEGQEDWRGAQVNLEVGQTPLDY